MHSAGRVEDLDSGEFKVHFVATAAGTYDVSVMGQSIAGSPFAATVSAVEVDAACSSAAGAGVTGVCSGHVVRHSVCLSICMSVCLSVCLSVCMSVCMSVCVHAGCTPQGWHNQCPSAWQKTGPLLTDVSDRSHTVSEVARIRNVSEKTGHNVRGVLEHTVWEHGNMIG